jgi:hypothetical protein
MAMQKLCVPSIFRLRRNKALHRTRQQPRAADACPFGHAFGATI